MSIRFRTLVFTALITTAALAAAGCNSREPDGKVLATVNGAPITDRDVALSGEPGPHGSERVAKDLQYIISEELLSQQGKKIGLDQDATYKKQLARLREKGHGLQKQSPQFAHYVDSQMRTELARRVFDTQIASRVSVTLPEAKEYYQKNKETINTELHLGLLKYRDQSQAEKALQRLRKGESFEAVARERLKDPQAVKVPSDVGYVPWREIPIDFVEPIYKLKPGEVSGILGNQEAGFQIVKVYDSRRGSRELPFSEVSGSIMNGLRDLKIVQEHHRYLEQLKKEAKIVTF